ncbi:biopolymer transporter ExbD [Limnohabitans sp.]|uniref:ExbD/TolR family protein n=1 Tax=Limnohabitans sp. TaxID=1907725 RepID=UPI00286F49A2|nr:biopolymer transporter ExbD [Limnohabitans sp.]
MAFGRFERTPGQTPMSDINVTPLVDVMMVLLVIFIITAPLMVSALKLDLPKTEGAQASSAPSRFVKLSIDATGKVYLDDKVVTVDELKHSLNAQAAKALATDHGELPEVQLRADERVPYGRVVEVMGLAHQAGMNRIGFVTERKQPSTQP